MGGGGRYDKMVEKYANISVPAAGFSIGFEGLVLLLKERGFKIPKNKEKKVYIINQLDEKIFNEIQKERNAGKIVKVAYRNKNYKHQKEILESDGYTIIEW